jgi:hypothetical protein
VQPNGRKQSSVLGPACINKFDSRKLSHDFYVGSLGDTKDSSSFDIIESFIMKRSFASDPCGKGVSMEEVNGAIQDIAKYSIQTRREKLNVATPIMKKIKEICAAWNQAAQLITFTCGLIPSFCPSNVQIIPLSYPCAKIVATFPEGQSVHNLG